MLLLLLKFLLNCILIVPATSNSETYLFQKQV